MKGFDDFTNYGQLLGIPYKAGGRTPQGLDCYGVAMAAADIAGYELPDFDYKKLASLRPYFPLRKVDKPHEGCIAEIKAGRNYPAHCGVYVNKKDVIHATEKRGVRIDRDKALHVEAVYEITKKKA